MKKREARPADAGPDSPANGCQAGAAPARSGRSSEHHLTGPHPTLNRTASFAEPARSRFIETQQSILDLDRTFLPSGRLRQISRVTELRDDEISAEMELGRDHWVYEHHFPDDPIFPGCLMIEAAGQLVALWAWADGARGDPRLVKSEARFHHPVLPDQPLLRLRARVSRRRRLYLGSVKLFAAREDAAASVSIALAIQQRR